MGEGYSLGAVGITFALTLTGAALLGFWLDRRLGTLPLFTIIGTFLGMGLGGFWLYARLRRGEEAGRSDGE
jgi:F0F1-type ATP synthase assembly protein I